MAGQRARAWDHCAFYAYILRVFRAFTSEACELGKQGTWTVDRIRSQADEFLRRSTIEAYYEKGRDRFGQKFPGMTSNWNGSLLSEVERSFHDTERWRQYEAELLAVAEGQAERGFPKSNQSGAAEPIGAESTPTEAVPAPNGMNNGTDRRAAVDAYIEEVFNRKGKRITKTDIWKSARYKSRTEFERWQRNDLEHPNETANQRFTRVLAEKPHLK